MPNSKQILCKKTPIATRVLYFKCSMQEEGDIFNYNEHTFMTFVVFKNFESSI